MVRGQWQEQFQQPLLSEPQTIAAPGIISEHAFTPLADRSSCAACLAEAVHPGTRRHHYPFTTCTQCGPRYTIMQAKPFDRATTGMAGFPPCAACRSEYDRPADRRFHAQTIACAACGPSLAWHSGTRRVRGNAASLDRAVDALLHGAIVAVKGIGGYHVLCDACDDAVVRTLRARMQRHTRPLAVLFPRAGADELDHLRLHCAPDTAEASCLRAPERPIVLVRLRADSALSPSLAPGLAELGAMLPCSPLQDLIVGRFGGPLVATSGGRGGDPMLTDPQDAEQRLAAIADAFLHHDRPILRPADDGVVRIVAGRARPLRLGRGHAPLEHHLSRALAAPVLALGGRTEVTLALGFGARVVVSPHVGDLAGRRGLDLLEKTAVALQRLCGVRAHALVCDTHPGCASVRWAAGQGLSVLRVAHHHAHAAAVAGEFPHEPRLLCFTWDGTPSGDEALLGRPGAWLRAATLRSLTPPRGERAAREPWRAAAAALLGRVWHASHAADAAMALEALAQEAIAQEAIAQEARGGAAPMLLPFSRRPDGVWQTNWAPLVPMLLDPARSPAERACVFHASLVRTLLDQARAIRAEHGDFAVGLGGSVFQNRRLSEAALLALQQAGFRACLPAIIPCNDAGLSFGQVVEAAARGTMPP